MNRSGTIWPWALGTVLAVTVAGNLWVMRLASADPSFAVEPDYYRKAVDWDSTMAQRGRNDVLGWQLTVESMPLDGAGVAALTVRLRDQAGLPVDGAVVQVAATHNAEAERIVAGRLAEVTDGRYTGPLAAQRAGIWELRFSVERDGERFTARVRHDTARDAPIR